MELELTLDNFDAEIGKSTPILVDFWAAWCGPCRMLSGVIQQLANESDGSYRVGKVNVDEQPELAKRFGIASIPTVILFRNGEAVQRQMGVALGIFMRADGQCGGEPVEAVLGGILGRTAHPQPIADRAATAALRLVLEARDSGVELLRVVVVLHHGHAQRMGCCHELLQLFAAAEVFLCRPCVGVIVKHCDLKILAQLFQHCAGAGAAAGVEQKARPGAIQRFEHGIHLLCKIQLSCHCYHPLL